MFNRVFVLNVPSQHFYRPQLIKLRKRVNIMQYTDENLTFLKDRIVQDKAFRYLKKKDIYFFLNIYFFICTVH